jgi:hypothetical protein
MRLCRRKPDGLVRAHDLAGQRLGAKPCLAERFDVLPQLLALFDYLALFGRCLVEQTSKRAALGFAFFGELPLCTRLLVELVMQLIDISLVRSAAIGELRAELIPLVFGTLQPGSQVLKVRSTLLEKLFELVLGRKGALKRLDGGRRLFERPLDDQHPLARIGGVGLLRSPV